MTIEQAQARDKIIDKITVELHSQLIELFPDILEAISRQALAKQLTKMAEAQG